MLSESAEKALAFLQTIPESGACEECTAAYTRVDRYEALKAIRELIQARYVLCSYATCPICRERRLVAHIRPIPKSRIST